MRRVVRGASGAPSPPQPAAEAYAAGRPRGIGYRPTVDDALFLRTVQTLTAADPRLAEVVAQHGVPPLWLRPAGFPSLVLFILEQQVSLASAAAAYRKVVARTGAMTPAAVLATTPEELRLEGVSRQKDRYLRALATAVETGALDLPGLAALDDEEVRRTLMTLPGVGVWTADVYLLACLGRPDLWPVGDRALQVAAAEAMGLPEVPDRDELGAIGEQWRPHRSTAARLLWHGYLVRRNRVETPNSLFG
jgi:DNA-3-methyladenine glycosylase II